MKLTSKVVLWAWLILVAILGSLIYGAYSKLNPDSLVSLLNTQIQRSYPGANLAIAGVDYGFSLDFKLKLQDLVLTRANKTIASAKEVQLKVPWWLILFNRGNAAINVSNVTIFVSAHSSHSNSDKMIKDAQASQSNQVKMDIPQYLLDAHYTLRAKNISIKEIDGDRRFFTLSKLLVREFQYGKNSAFELNIPISITHKDKKYFSDLWLFGDITPEVSSWNLNYRGEFKTRETADGLEFDDLVIEGKSKFNPQSVDLYSAIDISIDKKKVGSGTVSAKYDELNFQLKFSEFPLGFLNLIGDEIRNPFWTKIEGVGEGEIEYTKNFSHKNSASILAKLHFPGAFTLGKDHQLMGQWHLNFDNEKWKTSFISDKQELKFERRALLDFTENRLAQYHQELHLKGLDLKEALLTIDPLAHFIKPLSKTEHTSVVLLTDCLNDKSIVNATFKYGITPQQNYYMVDIREEKSFMSLNYGMKKSHQLEVEFSQFQWRPYYQYLAPYFSASSGLLSGKVSGKWSDQWSEGTWLSKINSSELQQPAGEFIEFNQKLWSFFGIDTTSFEKRSWSGHVDKNQIKIDVLELSSTDPALLSGILNANPKSKSHLTLNYPKNKKWKPVKKEITEIFWKKETL